ncbi:hypothetical protein ACFLUA_02405 [Chloroflexota bacterium]
MRSRRDKAKKLVEELELYWEIQITLANPASRSIPLGEEHKTQMGYNLQVSVDAITS